MFDIYGAINMNYAECFVYKHTGLSHAGHAVISHSELSHGHAGKGGSLCFLLLHKRSISGWSEWNLKQSAPEIEKTCLLKQRKDIQKATYQM